MPDRAYHAFLRLSPRDIGWAWLVLALGLAITGWAWRNAELQAAAAARRLFDARTAEIASAIVNRIGAYEQMLRGGLGLFIGSDAVSRAEWRRYVEALNLERTYPGIQGIGYARWIAPEALEETVARIRAEDFPEFSFHPGGPRDAYTAIVYLEPLNRRNREAIGYDMWSEPVRRAAMAAARDQATPIVSGKVTLVQEIDEDVQAGFLIYLPHYATLEPPETVEGRRAMLLGFVYSPFRMGDLMRGVDFDELNDVRVRIYDGAAASPEALMYDSRPDARVGELAETVLISLPGHLWTARFSALPTAVWKPAGNRPTIILMSGAVISLLFFGIALTAARTRRAQALSARLGRIIEDSVSEVYVFDPDRLRFQHVNRGARENLGYDMDELRRLTPFDLAPAFSRAAFEALLRPLRDGSEEQVRAETPIRRKDGSAYEAEVSLQLSRGTRPPAFIAIVQDVTERRRAEQHQKLLMDELNHRVKNTLATVQSLAARTLQSSGSPAQFVRAFKGRLAALAASHTLLTQTYWNGADLGALVQEHLVPYRGADRGDLLVEGPPVFLKPAAALALGLALHELATNAAKHGALSVPSGSVRVVWRIDRRGEGADLVLDWIESGGPPVPLDPAAGFGRTVIERGLAYELDGVVTLDFRPEGLRCAIVIPLAPETAEIGGAAPRQAG